MFIRTIVHWVHQIVANADKCSPDSYSQRHMRSIGDLGTLNAKFGHISEVEPRVTTLRWRTSDVPAKWMGLHHMYPQIWASFLAFLECKLVS